MTTGRPNCMKSGRGSGRYDSG